MDHKAATIELERTALFVVLQLLTLNERTAWAALEIALDWTPHRTLKASDFDDAFPY